MKLDACERRHRPHRMASTKRMTPHDQMSAALPSYTSASPDSAFRAISGGMYAMVPTHVCGWDMSSRLAIPKSGRPQVFEAGGVETNAGEEGAGSPCPTDTMHTRTRTRTRRTGDFDQVCSWAAKYEILKLEVAVAHGLGVQVVDSGQQLLEDRPHLAVDETVILTTPPVYPH